MFLDIVQGAGTSFSSALSTLNEPVLAAIESANEALADFKRLYGVTGFTSISDCITKLKRKPKMILSSHCLVQFTFKGVVELINEINKSLDPNGVVIIEVPAENFRDPRVVNALMHLIFYSLQKIH